jgi:uncharacterized membrane protein
MYCLLVLNTIRDYDGYTFIPSISIFVAILAALINIVLLIIFIHQIAVSIQADHIISEIFDFITAHIETQFEKNTDEELQNEKSVEIEDIKSKYYQITPLLSPKNGYLQYIDTASLVELNSEHKNMIELQCRAGIHMVKNMQIGVLYTNHKTDQKTFDRIMDNFVIGKGKTAQQDLEFSILQMVEIAVRALSPGINDPFTAISCIDNLTSVLCYLPEVKFPSKYKFDKGDNLRLTLYKVNFESIMDAAFNQIRQNSTQSTAVIIRLMEAMITIHELTKSLKQKQAVLKHAEMIRNVGKKFITEPNDFKDFNDLSRKIISE